MNKHFFIFQFWYLIDISRDTIFMYTHLKSSVFGLWWLHLLCMLQSANCHFVSFVYLEKGLIGTHCNYFMQLILYGTIMAVVSVISCITVFVINTLTSRIQKFALDISRKTSELEDEKRLTDKLLYEMIPRYTARVAFLLNLPIPKLPNSLAYISSPYSDRSNSHVW